MKRALRTIIVALLLFAILPPAQAQTLPPQTPPAVIAVEQQVQYGWNLLYNQFKASLDVASTFGSYDQPTNATWTVQTIWTWDNITSTWGFWSPALTAAQNESYAQKKGYILATKIGPGQGYWLNSTYNTSLPRIVGEQFVMDSKNFGNLPDGWNITGGSGTPSQFNKRVNLMPVQSCVVPTQNFETLWAWDTSSAKWIFYAPKLEEAGGTAGSYHASANGYLDGTYWYLQAAGFWVNKIQLAQTPPSVGSKQSCTEKG